MDGRQPDHDAPIQEFLEWRNHPDILREGCCGPDNEVDTRYIPESALEAWMTIERITRLLQALFHGSSESAPNPTYVKRNYLRPFAILLCTGFGRMIRHFVEHPNLRDQFLPFSAEPPSFPKSTSPNFFSSFNEQQWHFCPVKLEYDMSHDLGKKYILPIVRKERIGSGGSAILYKIMVDGDYNGLIPDEQTDVKPSRPNFNTFALKTYRTSEARKYFDDERNAFMNLRNENKPHPSIIGYYGSFIRDGTYNIILEYADRGNLNDYMASTHEPTSGSEIMMFWTRFLDIMHGLAQIHGTRGPVSGSILLGYTILAFYSHTETHSVG
ncbi:MAG: hypothetical protein Q9218_001574 [Villophora microphyllina]